MSQVPNDEDPSLLALYKQEKKEKLRSERVCLRQKDKECTMTSLAMLLYENKATSEHVDTLYETLGHRRQAVHIQEVLDLCYQSGLLLVAIDSMPAIKVPNKKDGMFEYKDVYSESMANTRLVHYMSKYRGLCYLQPPHRLAHMVYWDTKAYYDPASQMIHESFPPFLATFYAAVNK